MIDWKDGIDGSLKDMLGRRLARRLKGDLIQLHRDISRSEGDGWFIMFAYNEYKLRSLSAGANTWIGSMCRDKTPHWARTWSLNAGDPELCLRADVICLQLQGHRYK